MSERIQQLNHHFPMQPLKQIKKKEDHSFKDILSNVQHSGEIKMSKHAKKRLQKKNIRIKPKQWQVITEKVDEAKEKESHIP